VQDNRIKNILTLCAVIAGSDEQVAVAEFGKAKEKWYFLA